MIARLLKREQSLLPVINRQRVDRYHTRVAGDVHPNNEERHVRCSGALHRNRDLRWVTMMISLDLFASLASQPACPQERAPTVPFCQTVSQQSGSAHPGLKSISSSTMQKPPSCRLQQKKNESFWRSRRWTHLPTKLHRGRLSPAVCKGAGGFGQVPMGPPKTEKKS